MRSLSARRRRRFPRLVLNLLDARQGSIGHGVDGLHLPQVFYLHLAIIMISGGGVQDDDDDDA